MSEEWDSKTVIGSRARATPKAATEKDVNAARRSGAAIDTERKATTLNKTSKGETDHQRIAALDRTDEPTAPKTLSLDVGKAIQKGRKDLDMTQKDLAQKINEKPTVIQDYESSKAIPSPQVLSKLEKTLKIKLRGKDIGEPLLSPAEKKAQKEGTKK